MLGHISQELLPGINFVRWRWTERHKNGPQSWLISLAPEALRGLCGDFPNVSAKAGGGCARTLPRFSRIGSWRRTGERRRSQQRKMLLFGMKAKCSFQGEPKRLSKQWSQTVWPFFRASGKESWGLSCNRQTSSQDICAQSPSLHLSRWWHVPLVFLR